MYIWLVVSNMAFIFPNIWDVIRNPLTNSIIFQRGRYTTNQIYITYIYIFHHITIYNHHYWYYNHYYYISVIYIYISLTSIEKVTFGSARNTCLFRVAVQLPGNDSNWQYGPWWLQQRNLGLCYIRYVYIYIHVQIAALIYIYNVRIYVVYNAFFFFFRLGLWLYLAWSQYGHHHSATLEMGKNARSTLWLSESLLWKMTHIQLIYDGLPIRNGDFPTVFGWHVAKV